MITIAVAMGVTAMAYIVLVYSSIAPVYAMVTLGLAYAFANVAFWASIPMFLEQHLMSMAAGVVLLRVCTITNGNPMETTAN